MNANAKSPPLLVKRDNHHKGNGRVDSWDSSAKAMGPTRKLVGKPVPKLKTVQPSVARCKNPVQEINPEFVKTSCKGLKPEDQKAETANQNQADTFEGKSGGKGGER